MEGGMAVGKNSKAYKNAIAVGEGVTSHGMKLNTTQYSSLGATQKADYTKYTEGGVDSYYHKDGGVAFGKDIGEVGSNSVSIGTNIHNPTNDISWRFNQVAMGNTISDFDGIAIGNSLKKVSGIVIGSQMTNVNGTIVGNGNQVSGGMRGMRNAIDGGGVVFGNYNDVAGNNYPSSIAIGNDNTAKVVKQTGGFSTVFDGGSVAIGEQVKATGYRSIGMGMVNRGDMDAGLFYSTKYTKATADDTIALGTYAEATTKEAIAIGKSAIAEDGSGGGFSFLTGKGLIRIL